MNGDDRSNSKIVIRASGTDPTVLFAANELGRYLKLITDREVTIDDCADPAIPGVLSVGLIASFPRLTQPAVADPSLDDAISIDVKDKGGIIAGINPRSVLIAVYRYLTEIGCRWVRPGPDGEHLPGLDSLPDVRVEETPSYRHRAVCIEGAVSYDHVRDTIDWLPKLGFNGYFIQFREAHTFFDRWYSHKGNPALQTEMLSVEKAREYTEPLANEIKMRGLMYHKVGHGWTCEPFGISGLGWEKATAEPPSAVAPYLAEVNGKREFWKGVALDTNLCYSNPEVRRIMVESIATYAAEHPEIDYLHVWLADGTNNNCECEGCRKARPSDFYVSILNDLDRVLAERGLETRIVFLIYVDLLWPPIDEKLEHPDRFVLMFAPIVRTYSESFRVSEDLPKLPPYTRNNLDFPKSVAANMAFLKAWQKDFEGDSFDFDYHLMWDHSNDPGHMQISQTIHQDMKGLRNIGLNGFVSCQVQRVFFPTGLAMTVMGRTLWDTNLEFEDIARDYFESAFGKDASECRNYLTQVSDLFDPPFLRGERKGKTARAVEKLNQIPEAIQAITPVINRNLGLTDACHARSWFYLKHHCELIAAFADLVKAKASGCDTEAAQLWRDLKGLVWDKEPDLHRVFDAWLFTDHLEPRYIERRNE